MNLGLDAGADSAAGVLGPLGQKAGKGVGARFQMAGAKGAANGSTPGFMALLSALEPSAQTLGQQIPRAMSGGPTTAERGVLPQEVGIGADCIAAGGAGGADLADATGSSDAGDSDLMLLLAQSDAMASGARPEPELMRLETAESASGLALNAPLQSIGTNERMALNDVEPALSIPAGQESLLLLPTAAGWLPPTVTVGSQTSGSQLALATNSSLDVSSTPQGPETHVPGKLPARPEETMQSGNGGAFVPSPERNLRSPLESVMAKIEAVDQFVPSTEQAGPAQTAVSAMLGNSSPAQKPVVDASVSMSRQEASGFMALAPRDISMTDQQSGSQSYSQSQGQKDPKASTELSAVPMRTDTPWAQALASQEIRYEARDVFTPLSAETPEATLAENVTYWAAQGVQNAELKLDAWGGEALEVSISMNGNQAEVEFRTDQSEIREVIEGAMTQLKDMLAEEGLVLSGVAVGTSSGQGGGTSERRPPQGSRQAVRQAISEEVSAVGRRHGTGMGQALDLFV